MAKGQTAVAPGAPTEQEYHPPTAYLHDEHMKKMGMKQMPKIGDRVPMHGRVTSVSQRSDGSRSMEMELEQMVQEAEKPEHANDHEGKLKGAKAAMDRALDQQEMSKSKVKKHRKQVGSTGAPAVNPEGAGEED